MKAEQEQPRKRGSPQEAASADIVDLEVIRRRKANKMGASEAAVSRHDEQHRRKSTQNIGALLLIAAIVAGGAWLIVQLQASMRLEACIESGRRNCGQIELSK